MLCTLLDEWDILRHQNIREPHRTPFLADECLTDAV